MVQTVALDSLSKVGRRRVVVLEVFQVNESAVVMRTGVHGVLLFKLGVHLHGLVEFSLVIPGLVLHEFGQVVQGIGRSGVVLDRRAVVAL